MHLRLALFLALVTAARTQATVNIVQCNDDGWAEINIRALYESLTDAGYSSIISAPADNKSGTGSLDAPPTTVGADGCEFGSCPPDSPAVGANASMPALNYVNSYPVTAMRYGIQNLSMTFFGGPPDLAVSGFNVGPNVGVAALGSGTVGAACEAVKEGVPAIAFSGATGSQTAWNAPMENLPYVGLYANLSKLVADALTEKGGLFLPPSIWLNVNLPRYSTTCSKMEDVRFVLSRIFPAVPFLTPKDVVTCGNGGRLPTETSVITTSGCFASISVGRADLKVDANAAEQAIVLQRLKSLLSCLPASSPGLIMQTSV